MNFTIPSVDLVEGKITYTLDGKEVVEELNFTALINAIIAFINALIKNEF